MDVYECVRSLRTVRQYRPEPVPEPVVMKVLRAGRWAPSSRNQQPWRFIVITDGQTLARIGEIATSGRFVAGAPMAIAVVMADADSPGLDAGRAIQHMELVAWSEGLGTCFVGLEEGDQKQRVKELLEIPADAELITVLPFGYRADGVRGGGKRRRPMSEIVHGERFGQRYRTG